jgi:hypothetical protein
MEKYCVVVANGSSTIRPPGLAKAHHGVHIEAHKIYTIPISKLAVTYSPDGVWLHPSSKKKSLPIFFFFSRDHSVLGPLFRTAGHLVRTQHGVTASAGQRRSDVEVSSYLRDQAGSRSLVVFDLSITHDRFGSSSHVQQNGSLSHPQDLDGPMRVAAQRKTNAYKQTYADNQNISFLPAIMSTSNRIHGEFLRLLFLQAHRETEAHFTATGMPLQRNQSESFRFKRAAFYQGLKSKVGLAAAKAAALRINLNVQGCSIVAAPMHAPSLTSLLLPLLLSHNLPLPRVH